MVDLGDRLDIYCRYCKRNLNGVVSAVQDGKVAKVRCQTCGHFQPYQPPRDMKKAKERALKRLVRSHAKKQDNQPLHTEPGMNQETAIRHLWDQETQAANVRNTRVYDVHHTYGVGDFIAHKALGLGKVMEVGANNRLKVLFRDRIAELEHGLPRDDDDEE